MNEEQKKGFDELNNSIKELKEIILKRIEKWNLRLKKVDLMTENLKKIKKLSDERKKLIDETCQISEELKPVSGVRIYANEKDHEAKCDHKDSCLKKRWN